jgi:hypothetical protein
LVSDVVAEAIQRYDARDRTRRTAGTREDRGGVADMSSTSAISRAQIWPPKGMAA